MSFCVPIDEQETIINFGRNDKTAYIYTSDTTMMTKLDKLCKTSEYYVMTGEGKVDGQVVDKRYEVLDKKLISFRSKKVERELTDEQREIMAERFRINMSKSSDNRIENGE